MTLKDTSPKTTFIPRSVRPPRRIFDRGGYEGLTEGTKYYFAVKARNIVGESAFSTVANRRTY